MTTTSTVGSSRVEHARWTLGMELGRGYNTASCEIHNTPFATVGTGATAKEGQDTYETITLIENSSDYFRELDVSVQAGMDMGAYSGNATAKYARQQKVTSSSTFLVLHLRVLGETTQLTTDELAELQLAAEVREVYDQDPEDFLERYGDHFVSGFSTGGELVCTVEIITNSVSDKRTLGASLKAKGEGFSGSAHFKDVLETATHGRNVNLTVHKVGGHPLHQEEMTAQEFLDMASAFPKEVAEQPRRLDAILTPYQELTSLNNVRTTRDRAALVEKIQDLGVRYAQLNDTAHDLSYMRANPAQFLYPKLDLAKVDAALKSCEDEKHVVRKRVDDVLGRWRSREEIGADPTFKTIAEIMQGLPVRLDRLPQTAADLRKELLAAMHSVDGSASELVDGVYYLYLEPADISSQVELYCHDMNSPHPTEYLELKSAAEGANTSWWPGSPNDKWRSAANGGVRSQYTKIRFDPVSRTVVLSDATFAISSGHLWDHDAHGRLMGEFAVAPYATASASNHEGVAGREPRTPFGTTNVDLRGTAFRIADGVTWKARGFDCRVPSGQSGKVADPERRTISVQVGGAPGTIGPDELRLERS